MTFGVPDINLDSWGIKYIIKKKPKKEEEDEDEEKEEEEESNKEEYEDEEKEYTPPEKDPMDSLEDEEDKNEYEEDKEDKKSETKQQREDREQKRADREIVEMEKHKKETKHENTPKLETTDETKFGTHPADVHGQIAYARGSFPTEEQSREVERKMMTDYINAKNGRKIPINKEPPKTEEKPKTPPKVGGGYTETINQINTGNPASGESARFLQTLAGRKRDSPNTQLSRLREAGINVTGGKGNLGSTIGRRGKSMDYYLAKSFILLEILKEEKELMRIPQGLSNQEMRTHMWNLGMRGNARKYVGSGKGGKEHAKIGGKVKPISDLTPEEHKQFNPSKHMNPPTQPKDDIDDEHRSHNTPASGSNPNRKRQSNQLRAYYRPEHIREAMNELKIEGEPKDLVVGGGGGMGQKIQGKGGKEINNYIENKYGGGYTGAQSNREAGIKGDKIQRLNTRDSEYKKQKQAKQQAKQQKEDEAKKNKEIASVSQAVKRGELKDIMVYSKFRKMHPEERKKWVLNYLESQKKKNKSLLNSFARINDLREYLNKMNQ